MPRPLIRTGGKIRQLSPGNSLDGIDDGNNISCNWDFLNNTTAASIWTGGALASGTITAATNSLITGKHPGVLSIRSSTTANSGYRFISSIDNLASMVLAAGVKFTGIFQIPAAANPRDIRIGFLRTNSNTASSHAAEFRISSLAVTVACTDGGTSSSAAMASLTADTWYTFEVVVNSTSSVTFNIYLEDGTLHSTATITSNVPTSYLGCGFVAWSSGTTATTLCYVDFLELKLMNIGRR